MLEPRLSDVCTVCVYSVCVQCVCVCVCVCVYSVCTMCTVCVVLSGGRVFGSWGFGDYSGIWNWHALWDWKWKLHSAVHC